MREQGWLKKCCWPIRKLIIMNQRMIVILWLLLLIAADCAIYPKISTQFGNSLTSSDFLISTLGLFRMTLNPPTCQLQIQNFTGSNYGIVGYYPRIALSACQSLSIRNNSLQSNNNDSILSLQATQLKSFYDQVFVTIDEMGIIRINGVYSKRYESSQNWISIFRSPRQYIYSISNLSVTIYNSLEFIQNGGNWGFSATNGQLRLFRVDNVSKIIRYNYTSFTITPNNLFDYNSNSLPLANYNEFRYYSTCSSNGYLENFQGPFIFVINSFWPEIRLMDRNGYEIIALRYPNPHCMNMVGVNFLHDSDSCMSWFCPQKTFEFNGDCVSTCPLPYYHQIGKNGVNRCVINCQANFNKDSVRRVCACGPLPIYNCPAPMKSTPFACLCSGSTYFNPYNQALSNSSSLCFSSCGPFLYPHRDGFCVPCPKYCQTCILSKDSFSYLQCSVCQQGFHINAEGFCLKNCLNSLNQSISNACSNCTVPFCHNCSSSIDICNSCTKPYSLYNNSCVVQCPKGYKSQFLGGGNFKCVLVPGCNAQSIVVSDVNNQSTCFCTRNGNPTYSKSCGNSQSNSCAFDYYFDNNTMQCLACPIGCLTCLLDTNSKIECTSCRPDYSLFITVSKNHYCQRNSILSICPNTYDFKTQICCINNLNQTVVGIKARSMCFLQTFNCSVCVSGSSVYCSICANNLYLFRGICYQSCPLGTTAYQFQRVCVPIEQQNCLVETTESAYWLFTKTSANQNADGYFYMITANFQASDYLNDPLGSIFSFLRTPDIQSRKKLVNIATSYQKCLICSSGFGLAGNGKCLKCIFPCLQCVYISSISPFCLRCDADYRLNGMNACQKLNVTELPCSYGNYRNESRICQEDCLIYFREDYFIVQGNRSYSINCTTNCPNGYTVSTYLNERGEQRLKCSKNGVGPTFSITFLGSSIRQGQSTIYMLISSKKLSYAQSNSVKLQIVSSPSSQRLLSSQNRTVIAHQTDFGIIVIDSSPSLSDSSIIIKLQAAKMSSVNEGSQIFLSNSIYGFDSSSKPFIDLIFNETSNLYFYGRAYIVIAFLLTIIFLAEKVNYKTDNLFTTFSVIYLVLPSLNLQTNSSSLNSYSFLYGFAWSTHLELFSNPRLLTRSSSWFGSYLEKSTNNAHYLLFVDNNFVRNGWSIMLVLAVTVGALGLIAIIMKCFTVHKIKNLGRQTKSYLGDFLFIWSKIGYNNSDFDHVEQVSILLLFLIENSFIGLTYYAFINLFNRPWQLASADRQTPFMIVAILFLAFVVIYSLFRTYTNRIGGLYCWKRLFLGLSLGLASTLGGVDENKALSLLLLLTVEVAFTVLRYKTQFVTNYLAILLKSRGKEIAPPKMKIKTRHTLVDKPIIEQNSLITKEVQEQAHTPEAIQFWTMIGEEMLIMALYIFLVLVNSLKEVSILVIWIIVNAFMVNFILEFVNLIVNFWSRTYDRAKTERPVFKRIRNNWDHELSMKSLTSTMDL